MKRITTLLICAISMTISATSAWAEDALYTLSFTKDTKNSSYTTPFPYTSGGKSWTVCGNLAIGNYIRVGGKNTTATNRTMTSQVVISSTKQIGKVSVNHNGTGNGKNSSITVNSITVEGSTSSDFSSGVISKTISSPSVSSSGTLDFEPDQVWAANSYFRITVNYKITGSNNCYLTVTSVDFYEATSSPEPTITVNSSLSVPSYVVGTSEPEYETLSVNGSNLIDDITLSLGESSNFEMSTDLDTWTNSVEFTPSEGSVTGAEVAIRLKAGLSKGKYEGTLTLSSTDASSKNVSLSGTVSGQLFAINVDDPLVSGKNSLKFFENIES